MKQASNSFTKGMVLDTHPLTTQNTQVTDALNATLVTFNGNEMMLQNDMGNTLIQDSATGNIMGLNPGFIPIGLKEHGGIMYIASVNKEGKGEIGTIPSPIIRDIYKDKVTFNVNKYIPINSGDPIRISNKLYPADKFITNLQLTIDQSDIKGQVFRKYSGLSHDWESNNVDPNDVVIARNVITGSNSINPIYTPLVSYNWGYTYKPGEMSISIQNQGIKKVNLFSTKGVYNLRLFTQHDNIGEMEAPESLLTRQCYSINNETRQSNYWYLHARYPQSIFPKDLFEATLNKDLKQFPSSNKPGYMAVKLETEGITSFNMLPRKEKPYDTPITLKTFNEKNQGEYCVLFPGFYYSTESGIYIDKLKNIRLIDESTSDTVDIATPYRDSGGIVDIHFSQHDIQSITTWDGLLGRTAYSPYYRSPSTIGEFPQIQSGEDNQTFLLTTVPGVFTHTTTEFQSATVSNNQSIPPNTTGLMSSDIGSKYNNWYRLELDYYDQYDNKQGTFTKRFNPYLNDVFGTNLTVDGWIGDDKLVIGKSQTKTLSAQSAQNTHVLQYSIAMSKRIPNGGDYYYGGDTSYAQLSNGESNLRAQTISTNIKTPQTLIDEEWGIYLNYFYNNTTLPKLIDQWSASWSGFTMSGKLISSTDKLAIYKENESTNRRVGVNAETWYTTMSLSENPAETILLSGASHTINNWSENVYLPRTDDIENNITCNLSYTFDNNLIKFDSKELNGASMDYKLSDQLKQIQSITFGDLWQLGNEGNKYKFFRYTDKDGELLSNNYWTITCPIIVSVTTALWQKTFEPSYSITPYFCLTGTSEKGNPVYVQRFGKIDNTDLTYQHNFELGGDGHVYNYIPDQEATLDDNEIAPCSYNQLNEQHKFWYKKGDFTYKQRIQAGIYVLNIQRCPGTAIWIMSSNSAETTADDVTLVDMNIKVNAKTYSYDKRSIPYWIATPKFTGGIQNNQSAISDAKDRIYVPIVIIVKSDQDIEIGITSNNSSHPFSRQNIGLYKIQNVAREDIKLLNLQEDVYSYNTYMKQIQQKAQQLYKSDHIKYYNFIQKYGVFFKEAYVFIDGLLDGKLITNIQVKNGTYTSIPYIPKDPSILPVALDSDYNFIWNAYIMPKAVLDNSNQSFVFSNPAQWNFSTHTSASRSLRHEAQIDSNSGNSSVLPPLPPRLEWVGGKYDGIFDEITPLPVFPTNP